MFTEPSNDIILIVLPALVKLLQEPTGDIQEKAPLVLADLIKDDEEMQKAAYDADAISKLAELLASVSSREIENHTCQLGIPGMGSTAKRKEKIQEVHKHGSIPFLITKPYFLELVDCYCCCYFV